jgi:hypothetical protein
VKKISALFFLAIYLVSATELIQVLKLPLLFSHYAEHSNKEKNHSFLDFLKDHYVDDDGTISDNDTDRKLPFKETGYSGQLDLDFIPLSNAIASNGRIYSTVPPPVSKPYLFYSLYVPGIWQPPKIS